MLKHITLPLALALVFQVNFETANAQTRGNVSPQNQEIKKTDKGRTKRNTKKVNADRVNSTGNVEKQNTTPATTPSPGRSNQAQVQQNNNVKFDDIVKQIEQQAQPVVQNVTNGQVNWTQQYIEATGQAVVDNQKFTNPAQARLMAQRGAVVVAQRNLLEIIKGVNVTGETTVENMATTQDYIYTRVDGVIKGAQQIGQAIEKDGIIEVRMRVPMYGDNSLGNAVVEGAQQLNAANARMSAQTTVETAAGMIDGSKPLVFSIGGQQINPSMFPVVLDENGGVGLDLAKLYSATNSNIPKYLKATDDIVKLFNNNQNVDIIELLMGNNGTLKVADTNKKKINWSRIGQIGATIGKIAMMFL